MLRYSVARLTKVASGVCSKAVQRRAPLALTAISRQFSSEHHNPGLPMPKHGIAETEDEFDARYEAYFSNPKIDGWEIRKGINDMHGMDLIPEPKIIIACLKACRRVNDYALAVRYLEAIKFKCGGDKDIYSWVIQQIKPTLDELGISTPEEMGYDKPELALANPFDIH